MWQRWGAGLRWLDKVALLVIIGYAALAVSAQTGLNVAGQGLDPVWAAAQQRRTLRVAVDLGFYPFTWMEDGQPAGYDIDLARAIATRLGMQVEFVPVGLDSIYDDLAARRADVAISALPYAPELGWRARFSQFYFDAGQMLVVRRETPIATEADLAGRVVGVALGSDADTWARRRLDRRGIVCPARRLRYARRSADSVAARRRGRRCGRSCCGADRSGARAGTAHCDSVDIRAVCHCRCARSVSPARGGEPGAG
jgi:hypothetical protein